MGMISHRKSGLEHRLVTSHLVGRAAISHLRLDESWVSGKHAALKWVNGAWEIRDLGSRNGTFVGGVKLAAGERAKLSRGDTVAFGQEDDSWELVDAGPPRPHALHHQQGRVDGEYELIALPSPDDPAVIVYLDDTGWRAADGDVTWEVESGQTVYVDDEEWLVHLPKPSDETRELSASTNTENLHLTFALSSDGEQIEIVVTGGTQDVVMSHRAHHALLLHLARARVRDEQAATLPPEEWGWVQAIDVAEALDVPVTHLNMNIFRARKQFMKAGLCRSADVVERRRGTGALRLAPMGLSFQ